MPDNQKKKKNLQTGDSQISQSLAKEFSGLTKDTRESTKNKILTQNYMREVEAMEPERRAT